MGSTGLYPLPDEVCGYGVEARFRRARKESGQWVFWEDRVELVLAGRYDEVKPLHVELSPTYLCNFACPWCSCRTAREDWTDEDVFNHPDATEATVMGRQKLQRVLEHLAEYRIGIQWVGGEPTMNPLLYPMARAAAEMGLKQCLFTNGSLLHPSRVDALFEAGLIFIRVSLDAVTPAIHRRHHGYRADHAYARRVQQNLRSMAKRRHETGATTLIGVSVVVDETNIGDLIPTAVFLRGICEDLGFRAIDYTIVRPAYQFYAAQVNLRPDTAQRLQELMGAGEQIHAMLSEVGVDVVVEEASFVQPLASIPGHYGNECLAAGWFGEVTPNGNMVVCSDRYGNPDYFIGNIVQTGIDELWAGERRRRVLQLAQEASCFHRDCPRNGRGFHLNGVFHAIEAYRRGSRIDDVRRWIEDLRCVLPRPTHSFFL